MVVVNIKALDKFSKKHRDASKWLSGWRKNAEQAEWNSLDDVRETFASTDGVKLKSKVVVTVFNVKGNEYRLLTTIHYTRKTVFVLEVLTHEEYDREFWKEKY